MCLSWNPTGNYLHYPKPACQLTFLSKQSMFVAHAGAWLHGKPADKYYELGYLNYGFPFNSDLIRLSLPSFTAHILHMVPKIGSSTSTSKSQSVTCHNKAICRRGKSIKAISNSNAFYSHHQELNYQQNTLDGQNQLLKPSVIGKLSSWYCHNGLWFMLNKK